MDSIDWLHYMVPNLDGLKDSRDDHVTNDDDDDDDSFTSNT